MECVIFIGIQATGKSSFYQQMFFHSHVRINLDMLRTRHRENVLFEACLTAKQSVVIDNTNVTKILRYRYIEPAKGAKFIIKGYYFQSKVSDALRRNQRRSGELQVPDKAIYGTSAKLELPDYDEGFDDLYYVSITSDGKFGVMEWERE